VLENGRPRFVRRLSARVFDQEDLRAQTQALAAFLNDAAARYHFDRSRVVALGYSNGANIAASLLLTERDVLAGAILLRPMVPLERVGTPAVAGLPILISAGRADPIVPAAEPERLAAILRAGEAAVSLLWQDTGHALSPIELEQVAEWWLRTFPPEGLARADGWPR
jgi:phospholipase/carboxylesterase